MFRNYIKTALRHIVRHKGYSFINIAGLAIGIACCILILLWVQHELSFDRYHENAPSIYRLAMYAKIGGNELRAPVSNAPSSPAMIEEFPEVVNSVRLQPNYDILVQMEDQRFFEDAVIFADNSIFDVFTFPMINGNPESALISPYTVVITETIAKKYFGSENPIGKTIKLNEENDYTITGVVKDVPKNSHFTFNILCSFETLYAENREYMESWLEFSYVTYLLLPENCNYHELEQKFPPFVEKYMGVDLNSIGSTIDYFLQPLTDIHLHSHMQYEFTTNGDIANIYLFSGIAVIILLIACVNFINLSTARSATRAREVGVRKTFGAGRRKLIMQFLGESLFYSVIALILVAILLEILLPVYNSFTESQLSLNLIQSPGLIVVFIGIALFVGVTAGLYPALFLSSFKPVRVFKGNLKLGAASSRFRSILVVAQFMISIALIIGTITIYHQIQFMKNKRLGFNKEQVVVITGIEGNEAQSIDFVKSEFAGLTGVLSVGSANYVPGENLNISIFLPEGFANDESQMMGHMYVDPGFFTTLGIEPVDGRPFSADFPSDTSESLIINETAARKLGWDHPVGKIINVPTQVEGEIGWEPKNVIGVVRDFHLLSLHHKIEPLVMRYLTFNPDEIVVKIATGNVSHTVGLLKSKWNEIFPERPIDYYFLDESFNKLYRTEEKLGTITFYFSFLAIFVGCLGL
ncbi:hypothetical protein AMJ86_07405, partial [bacterium SM23_57]